jgi:superfamily II DNA or RNA helicase
MPSINLLPWQDKCHEKCLRKFLTARDFLCVATPGSGKTILALSIASTMWQRGLIQQVIVVVPSVPLTKQWTREAHERVHFDLEENGEPHSMRRYHGVVVTYSKLAGNALSYRACCQKPTLVIMDEIHHAEREKGWWGTQLMEAFQGDSIYRLALSGTPFRTSGVIAFLKYAKTEPGKHKALGDHYYGVPESIRDEICRRVIFPTIEVPRIEWQKGDHTFSASLSDSLSEDQERSRNQVVLDPQSDAVRLLLARAHQKLAEVRRTHPAAGALLLAKDHYHAQRLLEVLQSIIGQAPVYLSEELNAEEANQMIDHFDRSRDPWLLSVRRVSEGVDIKRLRVLAYLSNVETPVYFRQAVGRVVRRIKGIENKDAYVFVLAREPFLTMAAELEMEQEMEIPEDPEKTTGNGGGGGGTVGDRPVLISCDAEVGNSILTGGAAPLSPQEQQAGQYFAELYSLDKSAEEVALDLRDARTDLSTELPPRPSEPKSDRMKRKSVRANRAAYAVGMKRGYPKEEAAQRMHRAWKDLALNNHWAGEMDEEELDRKLVWLQKELARAQVA